VLGRKKLPPTTRKSLLPCIWPVRGGGKKMAMSFLARSGRGGGTLVSPPIAGEKANFLSEARSEERGKDSLWASGRGIAQRFITRRPHLSKIKTLLKKERWIEERNTRFCRSGHAADLEGEPSHQTEGKGHSSIKRMLPSVRADAARVSRQWGRGKKEIETCGAAKPEEEKRETYRCRSTKNFAGSGVTRNDSRRKGGRGKECVARMMTEKESCLALPLAEEHRY